MKLMQYELPASHACYARLLEKKQLTVISVCGKLKSTQKSH